MTKEELKYILKDGLKITGKYHDCGILELELSFDGEVIGGTAVTLGRFD
jgi:hypothetical protein